MMIKKLTFPLSILLFSLPALGASGGDSLKSQGELNHFIKQYVNATNTHRFSQVQSLLAKDAIFWFNGEESKGLVAIQAAFEQSWNYLPDEIYGIEKVEWLAVTPISAT